MGQLRWEYKFVLFFLAGCVVISVVLLSEWLVLENYSQGIEQKIGKVQDTGYQVDGIPEYKFLQHPIDYYSDMVNRPLFNQGRRPIVKVVEEEVVDPVKIETAPVEKFQLRLIGNIITPDGGAIALFENMQTREKKDKFKRLKKDDEYKGWHIVEVLNDRVLISDGTNKEERLLREPKPRPKGARPPKIGRAPKKAPQKKTKKPASQSPAGQAFKPLTPAVTSGPGATFN